MASAIMQTTLSEGGRIMRTKNKALNLLVCMLVFMAVFTVAMPDDAGLTVSFRGTGDKKISPRSPIAPPLDSVPPEAVIHFDADERDIVVYGVDDVDENTTVVVTIIKDVAYKKTIRYQLTDESGNLLELLLEHKSRNGNIEVRVLRMIYNMGSPIFPKENHYKIEFKVEKKTDELTHLHQNIHVSGEFKINTNYKPNEDKTRIKLSGKEDCRSVKVEGLNSYDLMTDKGELTYSRLIEDFEVFDGGFEECEDIEVIEVSPAQLVSLYNLENASAVPVEKRFDSSFGNPASLVGRWATDSSLTEPEDKAVKFMETYADLFRMDPTIDSFTIPSVKSSALNITNVKLQQTYLGVPVLGAEQLIHLENGSDDVLFVHGTFVPDIDIGTIPKINAGDAEDIAKTDLKNKIGGIRISSVDDRGLLILNDAVLDRSVSSRNSLVWWFVIHTLDPIGEWFYYVNAENGVIEKSLDNIRETHHPSKVYDGATSPDTLWYQDGVCIPAPCLPPVEVSWLDFFGGLYYDYLQDNHDWDSIDNDGRRMVGRAQSPSADGNAIWKPDKKEARFDVGIMSMDIVAHEYTHGLDQLSGSDLYYNKESGAISEHFSDTLAEYLDCDTIMCNWQVGVDAFGIGPGPWRDMSDPTLGGDPDHIDLFVDTNDDWGGVHTNSGILNKMAHLIAVGGDHYGYDVDPIGLAKAEQLIFWTQVNVGLTTTATFSEYHDVMLETCNLMMRGGFAGINPSDCQNVFDAWCTIGFCTLRQSIAGEWDEENDKFGYALVTGDFDGDDFDDLAVGAPYENHGEIDTGMVIVFYGSSLGLTGTGAEILWQSRVGEENGEGDLFGWALAAGNFNGDDYDDLAIGAPNKVVDGVETGIVYVFYGNYFGLYQGGGGDISFDLISPCIWGCEDFEDGDEFGYALAADDFNGDDFDDIAIGVPKMDLFDVPDAGGVIVIPSCGEGGLISPGDEGCTAMTLLSQSQAGARGEEGDRFGFSLASGNFNGHGMGIGLHDDLAVGAPKENIEEDGARDAGAVFVFYGSDEGFWDCVVGFTVEILTQADTGARNEDGDRFGWSLAAGHFKSPAVWGSYEDLAVGVPKEDIERDDAKNAGAVMVFHGGSEGFIDDVTGDARYTEILTQDDAGIANEGGDRFGYSLAALQEGHRYGLAVGVPKENFKQGTYGSGIVGGVIRHIRDAGLVVIFWSPVGTGGGLDDGTSETIKQEDVGGVTEKGDRFGFALASGDFNRDLGGLPDDLAISAPHEDLRHAAPNAGVVYVLDR